MQRAYSRTVPRAHSTYRTTTHARPRVLERLPKANTKVRDNRRTVGSPHPLVFENYLERSGRACDGSILVRVYARVRDCENMIFVFLGFCVTFALFLFWFNMFERVASDISSRSVVFRNIRVV
jgi:hypothetical protein